MIEPASHAEILPFKSRAAAERVSLADTQRTEWFVDRIGGSIFNIGALIQIGSAYRIKGLWVEPEMRGRGHGEAMVKYLIDRASYRFGSHVEAITVRPALYHRLRFSTVGRSSIGLPIVRRVL